MPCYSFCEGIPPLGLSQHHLTGPARREKVKEEVTFRGSRLEERVHLLKLKDLRRDWFPVLLAVVPDPLQCRQEGHCCN